jgi:hypothetical protein
MKTAGAIEPDRINLSMFGMQPNGAYLHINNRQYREPNG